MAGVKVSGLPNASALTGTEQVPITQSSTSKKSTLATVLGTVPFAISGGSARSMIDRVQEVRWANADMGVTYTDLSATTGANMTSVLQGIIDTMAGQGGGILRLLPGVLWVDGLQMRSRVAIVGSGRSSIVRLRPGANQHVFRTGPDVDGTSKGMDEQYCLAQLTIDGNRTAQAVLTSNTPWKDGVNFDLSFTNASYAAVTRYGIDEPQVWLRDLHIMECRRDLIFLSGAGGHIVENITGGGCSRSFLRVRCKDSAFTNLNFDGCGGEGIVVQDAGVGGGASNRFVNIRTSFTGMSTDWYSSTTLDAVTAVAKSDYQYGNGIFVDGVGNVFSGVEVQETWSHGLRINGARNQFRGVNFMSLASLRPQWSQGASSTLTDNSAIFLGALATDNTVEAVIGSAYTGLGAYPFLAYAVQTMNGALRNRVTVREQPGSVANTVAHHIKVGTGDALNNNAIRVNDLIETQPYTNVVDYSKGVVFTREVTAATYTIAVSGVGHDLGDVVNFTTATAHTVTVPTLPTIPGRNLAPGATEPVTGKKLAAECYLTQVGTGTITLTLSGVTATSDSYTATTGAYQTLHITWTSPTDVRIVRYASAGQG